MPKWPQLDFPIQSNLTYYLRDGFGWFLEIPTKERSQGLEFGQIYFLISNKENIILFQGWAHKAAHRVRSDHPDQNAGFLY